MIMRARDVSISAADMEEFSESGFRGRCMELDAETVVILRGKQTLGT